METVVCNCCGAANYKAVYTMPDVHFHPDEFFTVVECQTCGLGFVNPRPTRAEIGKYYPASYYHYFAHDWTFHQRRYQVEADYLQELTARAGEKRLLDVGCANGDFPRYMRNLGWIVEGVEPSTTSSPITDFSVYQQEFDQIPVDTPQYDAITSWAVWEHLHDPAAYFQKVAQILKPGGYFVFLVTNFESLTSRALYQEDVPRHLYFFTRATIQRFLSDVNMQLVRSDYNDKIYQMSPTNWLTFYWRHATGRAYTWHDLPDSLEQYLQKHQLTHTRWHKLQYLITHPLVFLDRRLLKFYTRWQIATQRYGIVTFVATKPAETKGAQP